MTAETDANLYHPVANGTARPGRELHYWTFGTLLPGESIYGGAGIPVQVPRYSPATVLLVCHCGALQRRPLPEGMG